MTARRQAGRARPSAWKRPRRAGRRSRLPAVGSAGDALPALVDDLLRPAVAGADHLAVGLRVGVDDVERELLDPVILDLGFDFGLELAAVFALRPGVSREPQPHYQCRNHEPHHFLLLAEASQLRPSNGRTSMRLTVPGSRQRALTLNPSGWDRGT